MLLSPKKETIFMLVWSIIRTKGFKDTRLDNKMTKPDLETNDCLLSTKQNG